MNDAVAMLRGGRNALVMATLAVLAMIVVMIAVPSGPAAIALIGGMGTDAPTRSALELALVCDTVLPVGYGAGLSPNEAGLSSPGFGPASGLFDQLDDVQGTASTPRLDGFDAFDFQADSDDELQDLLNDLRQQADAMQ